MKKTEKNNIKDVKKISKKNYQRTAGHKPRREEEKRQVWSLYKTGCCSDIKYTKKKMCKGPCGPKT